MSVISQFASGGVKSVQTGSPSAAGSVSITAVNTAKSVMFSVSKGSAGTVAATGTVTPNGVGSAGAFVWNGSGSAAGGDQSTAVTVNLPASTITGGTTNLTTKQFSAKLTNSTTVTYDGACEWQLVEYY